MTYDKKLVKVAKMREPVFTVSALLRQRRAGEHYDSDVRVFEKNSTGAKSATPQGLILCVIIFPTEKKITFLSREVNFFDCFLLCSKFIFFAYGNIT